MSLGRARKIPLFLAQLPHPIHSARRGRLMHGVEMPLPAAAYPPNCSVILLISLFKSLSVLREPSIFSTECSTVV